MRRDSPGVLIFPLLVALACAFEPVVLAGDGRFEINQACAVVGCFPGDDAGFPVEITNSGSYVVTGDLNANTGIGVAVTISGAGASLDLNGFRLIGNSSLGVGGIQVSGTDVEISNGQLTGFGAGITGSNAHRLRLLNLRITSCNVAGIDLGMTSYAQIRDSVISNNQQGIVAGGDTMMVTGNTVIGNTSGDGIRVGIRALVADNVVSGNLGDGIEAGGSSLIRGNVAAGNGAIGINLGGDTLVIGNTVMANAAGNIEVCPTCTMTDNHAP